MSRIATTVFCFISIILKSQSCETYNRELFRMLPAGYPAQINCRDDQNLKQGSWIVYELGWRAECEPDVSDTGDFVSFYSYGNYENDKKIGEWKTINNEHQVELYKTETFGYYDKYDEISIEEPNRYISMKLNKKKNGISGISVRYNHSQPNDTIRIYCDTLELQATKTCIVFYKNEEVNKIPIYHFEIELDQAFNKYAREMKLIQMNLH